MRLRDEQWILDVKRLGFAHWRWYLHDRRSDSALGIAQGTAWTMRRAICAGRRALPLVVEVKE